MVIFVEQLIPMLGLETIQHTIQPSPKTTPEKVLFIIENMFTHARGLTATISFSAFAILIVLRVLKRKLSASGLKYTSWVKFVPEIFVVVVIATSKPLISILHFQNINGFGCSTVRRLWVA